MPKKEMPKRTLKQIIDQVWDSYCTTAEERAVKAARRMASQDTKITSTIEDLGDGQS